MLYIYKNQGNQLFERMKKEENPTAVENIFST